MNRTDTTRIITIGPTVRARTVTITEAVVTLADADGDYLLISIAQTGHLVVAHGHRPATSAVMRRSSGPLSASGRGRPTGLISGA